MACEMVRSSQSSQIPNPLGSISILVVDDDATCLSIVSAILKSWKYEVVAVKHASDALCTLRIKGGSFDLVIADVHMPDMNGFELQKQIDEEFKLPVVFMSADGKDSVILRGLQSGAVFFIVKPISPEDLKHLWQYAVAKKKITKPTIEEITDGSRELFQQTSQAVEASDNGDTVVRDEDSNEDRRRRSSIDSKKNKSLAKDSVNGGNGENREDAATQKRAKVVWTNALHSQFLEAIRSIGLERAVPKKILEFMNVPGLTRENVASHLQKYRIFLKRVSEASCKLQSSVAERCTIERTLRSTFASRQPPNPMMFSPRISQLPPLQQQRQLGTPLNLKPPNFNREAANSSSNNYHIPPTRFGSAQATLLCNNQAGYHSLQNPMMGMANPSYQINHHPTTGLVNCGGTNLIHQKPPEALNNGLMLKNSYGNVVTFMNNSNSNQPINNVAGGNDQLNCLPVPVPVPYSTGFETPTFTDNDAIREENIAVPIISDESDHMILPTTFADSNGIQEQSSLGDGAGESADHDFVFGDDLMQPYGDGDLGFDFMNQINIQSPTQQDGKEATSSAFSTTAPRHDHMEDNHQSLDQQAGGDEVMVSNFGITRSLSDDYFPSFEPNPSQEDDEDLLESLFGSLGGNGKPGDSTRSNQLGRASTL